MFSSIDKDDIYTLPLSFHSLLVDVVHDAECSESFDVWAMRHNKKASLLIFQATSYNRGNSGRPFPLAHARFLTTKMSGMRKFFFSGESKQLKAKKRWIFQTWFWYIYVICTYLRMSGLQIFWIISRYAKFKKSAWEHLLFFFFILLLISVLFICQVSE